MLSFTKCVANTQVLQPETNRKGKATMGAIHVDVTIRSPADRSMSWQGSFLVDTGATDSVVALRKLSAVRLNRSCIVLHDSGT